MSLKKVDDKALAATVDQFVKERAEILRMGEDISDAMVALQQSWAGGASDAYTKAARSWTTGFQQSVNALDKITKVLDQNRQDLVAAETSLQRELEGQVGPIARMVGDFTGEGGGDVLGGGVAQQPTSPASSPPVGGQQGPMLTGISTVLEGATRGTDN